jgi:hypothetical protein
MDSFNLSGDSYIHRYGDCLTAFVLNIRGNRIRHSSARNDDGCAFACKCQTCHPANAERPTTTTCHKRNSVFKTHLFCLGQLMKFYVSKLPLMIPHIADTGQSKIEIMS